MIQWTCRLQDALARQGFWASYDDCEHLSGLSEVELSGPVINRADSTLFPRDFGWDDFVESIECECYGQMVLYRNGEDFPYADIDRHEGPHRSHRAREGQKVSARDRRNIEVLWLSQDVFISSINFQVVQPAGAHLVLWDYRIYLCQQSSEISHYA
jgi:hypothetical protein